MKILFINGSPNKKGNTAALAEALLAGKEYEILNLTDYRIGSYGQTFEDDQLVEVIAKMKEAEAVWSVRRCTGTISAVPCAMCLTVFMV